MSQTAEKEDQEVRRRLCDDRQALAAWNAGLGEGPRELHRAVADLPVLARLNQLSPAGEEVAASLSTRRVIETFGNGLELAAPEWQGQIAGRSHTYHGFHI